MTEEQIAITDLAYNEITEALHLLKRAGMDSVPGIDKVRQAVANPQKAVNGLS
jgi:2-iminoacetate synthase ThiH